MALSNSPTDPSVGSDPQLGTVYESTNYLPYYCDGGAGGTSFRIDAQNTQGSCLGADRRGQHRRREPEGGSVGAPYYIPAVAFNAVSSPAPAITSAGLFVVHKGHSFSFTVTTTGIPTPTVREARALPAGVTFTPHGNGTATLAGTPTTVKTTILQFTATSNRGTASQNFALVVKS